MESGYSKYRNPYHNLIHAADVLQTTYQIIYNSGLMVEVNTVLLSIFAFVVCRKKDFLILFCLCLECMKLDLIVLFSFILY